ncbi:MAG: enoyl-CoA hydratase/isomerase family protein [bacterium]
MQPGYSGGSASVQRNNLKVPYVNYSYYTIEWKVDQGIGHLVLNQPPSNQMTVHFFQEMKKLQERVLQMKELRAILIYGKGRHFSSGANLDELLPKILAQDPHLDLEANYDALRYFEDLQIPVISAIRGACLGSALELALFCHFRFCGEDAVFGLPETNFNLIPGIGGIQRFSRLAGKARALEYILTGRTFDAQTALELGLVDRIWPKKEVVDRALAFAKNLPASYVSEMREVYLMRTVTRD